MTKNTTTFYVETGNWRASIILDVKADEVENYDYIEAATRSLEAVFSESKETLEGNFELVTLMDKKGRDYFDPEYPGELSDIPNTLFGLLTACFLEKDRNKPEKWWYFLTSKLFANAAQHYNVELALEVESKYADQVKAFKMKEHDIKLSNDDTTDGVIKRENKKPADKKNKPDSKNPPTDDIDPRN